MEEGLHRRTGHSCLAFSVLRSASCPVLIILAWATLANAAEAGRDLVARGNAFYDKGLYDQAVAQYDQALAQDPGLDQARFNKAGAFFRMDDLAKAMDLYGEVSAQSKDMSLVKKAKYNLGNAHFQRGLKQRDSDLQKAVEDLQTSITCWRAVLDLDPNNGNAKRNKEVAGLIIKDIMDEIKKRQEQQKQDPNQANQKPEDRSQKSEERKQGQDPNQNPEPSTQNSEDPNQAKDPNRPKDPNQNQQPATNNQQRLQAADAVAQQILDKEQQDKKDRQEALRVRRVPVDKDW